MGIISALSKPFASYIASKTKKWSANPVETQQKWFRKLIESAQNTAFGKDHNFHKITSYSEFKQQVKQ